MKVLSVEDCKECFISNTAMLIDIRENWELSIYGIGIKHIPMANLVDSVSELDSSKQIILVCKTGRRAEALANLLETEYGFGNVAIMGGGVTAWAAKYDPTNEMY